MGIAQKGVHPALPRLVNPVHVACRRGWRIDSVKGSRVGRSCSFGTVMLVALHSVDPYRRIFNFPNLKTGWTNQGRSRESKDRDLPGLGE